MKVTNLNAETGLSNGMEDPSEDIGANTEAM